MKDEMRTELMKDKVSLDNPKDFQEYEIDWSALIVDIVKKRDLDSHEFANCWEEDYDWTELDKYVIENHRELLLGYGEVEADRIEITITEKQLEEDLKKYEKNL